MNGIVIKTKRAKEHIKDLDKVFEVLRKYKVKLNLKKCVFRVSA